MTPNSTRCAIRMVIFFLAGSSGAYGTETRFIKMAAALQERGAKIWAVERYPSFKRLLPHLRYESTEVRLIQTGKRKGASFGINLWRTLVKALKLYATFRPIDVVMSAERNFANVFPAFVLSRLINRPLVIVLHHATDVDFDHNGTNRTPLKPASGDGPLTVFSRRFHHAVGRRANLFVAVSQATKKQFCQAWGIDPNRVMVTGNGVKFRIDHPRQAGERTHDVIYLGRFTRAKGVYMLPSIWKEVVASRPESKLIVAGGSKSDVLEMEREVRRLELHKNITVQGYLTDEQASNMLLASKIFVLPSYMEGFSITTVDAMASGCVCIISDLPPLRELFSGVASFVTPGDVHGFAATILEVLDDKEKLTKQASRSFEHSKAFSWDAIASKEMQLYETLVRTRR